MATSNDSPSLFSGQQWADWAGSVLPDSEISNNDATVTEDIDTTQLCTATESMKLKTEDMPLFGVCPSRDEFYLVVCEKCNHVLKPQAFQAHLDIRHGGKGSHSTLTNCHHSSNRHSASSKSRLPSKTHSESSHSKNHSSPNKSHQSQLPARISPNKSHHSQLPARVSPLKISTTELPHSGCSLAVNETVAADVKSPILTKVTVKEPPQLFNTAMMVGADSDIAKDSKLNNNNSVPVVKVERMPETLAMKKQHESSGSARSLLTYGSVRGGSKFLPLPVTVINDIKPSLSPLPLLLSTQELDIGICNMHSVLDSAASSILEPVAPVSETDADDFVALATSSSTLTTNTVTMASLTASTTSVTNVRTTHSSFTFSSAGRPHFPLGSIRVHFSSSGVLSTIAKEGNNVNNNSINSVKSSSGSSITNDTIRSSLCSNGSMESTISDIVKSAVNLRNTGGFKSLSPLLISPSKGANSLSNHSLKSPSKLANIVNLSGYAKSGTQLIGSSNVFKSLSSGNLPSATKSSNLMTVVNTEAIKKFQLLSKPDKIIPLKDREYDANKHCGVVVAETGKPCTRSLTCKSHALSMRRSVTGRRLSFDDLLKEHKEAKEAYLKAKIESKEATAALKAAASANKGHAHHISPINRINSAPLTATSIIKPNAHLNQAKENKPLSLASIATSKPLAIQRPANLSAHSFGSISSQSSQDELQSPTSMKLSDHLFDVEDGSYTTYHPRPIAACSFGARNHNTFGSGFDCYTFGRRSDHMRSTFLDLLDKRTTDPSPPKKLCLDVNVPLEQPDLVRSTSDKFDFSYLDRNLNILGQPLIPGPASSISSAHSRVLSMQKSKSARATCCTPGLVSGSKPKLKDNICSPTSAGVSSYVNSVTPTLFTGLSAKKRRGSGCGTSHSAGSGCGTSHNAGSGCGTLHNAINVHTSLGTTLVTAPSILTNIGTITNTSGVNATQFAIAIPGVNISHIGTNLGTSLVSKHAKNNVIKDIGNIFVTGFPHDLLNGQLINITNSHLPTEIPLHQIQSVTQEDGNKSLQQFSAINNSNSFPQQKFINGIDVRALQTGKAGVFTSLPPNAVLLDSNLQSGTVLHPVTLTAATTASAISVSSAMLSQYQSSPATSANTLYRLNCASPHTSTSLVPNGVVSHSTDKELMTSQCHTVFQTKAGSQCPIQQSRPSFPLQTRMFTGSHLHNQSFVLQVPNSDTLSNESSGSARHLIPNQLAQLQIKNSDLIKQSINKLTMQPMSITIPFVTQNSIGGVEMGVGNQQHTHTLYITSDDNQGLHLQHNDQSQAHNSTSNSFIS